MRTGGKTALTVRGACLTAGLTFSLVIASTELPVQVAIDDGAVSIEADNQSIRAILEELSRQTQLVVTSEDALDELVSVQIRQPTLPDALRSLLRQKSYMLHQVDHAPDNDDLGDEKYSRLWIFTDELDSAQPGWRTKAKLWPDDDSDIETIDYQILALSDDSGDREEAMVGFGEIGGRRGIDYLQQGLSDPDERVREEAIESLIEIGGTESIHALGIALNDPDTGVRIDAVDAMGEIGGQDAIKYLQLAMTDENHIVREAAAEWLTELAWRRE